MSIFFQSTEYFKSTEIALDAAYGDFKFKPYFNANFHLRALASLFYHMFRIIYDIACLLSRLMATLYHTINPFKWKSLPGDLLNLADDVIGIVITSLFIAVYPLVVLARSFSSMILGYLEGNSKWHGDRSEEEESWDLATTVFYTEAAAP